MAHLTNYNFYFEEKEKIISLLGLAGWIMLPFPPDVHTQIPETCEYVTL